MTNLYNFNIAAYSEIDKYASETYPVIHNVSKKKNLGDVTKIKTHKLVPYNVLAGGSPCQDLSIAGKGEGAVWRCLDCGEEYNPLTVHFSERKQCPHCKSENIEKTRSSLLVHYLEVLHDTMPLVAFYENVKNLLSKNFAELFAMFIKELEEYGYNVCFKVLNGKDYGIPQNRERVILLAIRKDVDNGKFKFPEPFEDGKTFNDLLDDCTYLFENTDETIIIDDKIMPAVKRNIERDKHLIIASDKGIYRIPCTTSFQDNAVGIKYSPAITASNHSTIVLQKTQVNGIERFYIKKLRAHEALKFMGFDDEDYEKASSVVSDSQIYKQAGNSIIVDVIYAVFKELFKAMPYLFTDMKLLHLFSGIGSVEKGIKRVVDEANALALKGGDLDD